MLALLAVLLIGLVHRWVSQQGSIFLVATNLPVSFAHESTHYIAARLLGGRPSTFSVLPKKDRTKQWVLGSVTFSPTPLSALPVALAPLILLPMGFYLLHIGLELSQGSLLEVTVTCLVAYLLIAASIPSGQDFKVVMDHPASIIFWGGLVWGCYVVACSLGLSETLSLFLF